MFSRCTLKMSLLVTSLLGLAVGSVRCQETTVPVKAAAALEVSWRRDYNDARREQEEKKLPLLIDFYSIPCVWCDKMDASTFRDPKVVHLMNSRFIPLKIDGGKEVTLSNHLGIALFPTIVVAGADGKIIVSLTGYQEATRFLEVLMPIAASQTAPSWMEQDLILSRKWAGTGEYHLAISSLRKITEDGKSLPVQIEARKLLQEIDAKATTQLLHAHEMIGAGKKNEAVKLLTDTILTYAGTQASKEGREMLARIASAPSESEKQFKRTQAAQELLVQARDFYKKEEHILCMDRCAKLTDLYLDLPEGTEGLQLAQEIRNNPDWLQNAADTLSDRLGRTYLDLADTLLKKGQPQRAEFYLKRVVLAFPGSRMAESAQIRIVQLQAMHAKNDSK